MTAPTNQVLASSRPRSARWRRRDTSRTAADLRGVTITYSQRFHATRKPTSSLNPSLAHWYSPPSSGISWLR